VHGNGQPGERYPVNSVFLSQNHAARHHATAWVHNGLDPDDYGPVDWTTPRSHALFLGKARWKVKNLAGAKSIARAADLKLAVLGGGVAWQLLRAEAAPVELPQSATGPGHGAPALAAANDRTAPPDTTPTTAASSTPAAAVAQGAAAAPSSTTTPGVVLASAEVVLAASHGSTAAVILGAAPAGQADADAELLSVAGGRAWVGCLEPTATACGADERPLRAVEVAPARRREAGVCSQTTTPAGSTAARSSHGRRAVPRPGNAV
jgi:hypothetical protein